MAGNLPVKMKIDADSGTFGIKTGIEVTNKEVRPGEEWMGSDMVDAWADVVEGLTLRRKDTTWHPDISLKNFAYTLLVGREAMDEKFTFFSISFMTHEIFNLHFIPN